MFFICMLMSSVTFAQDITIVDDVATYTGSDAFVYSKKDGKVYAYNSMNEYELYGLYTKVNTLTVASGNDVPVDYIAAEPGMEVAPYINSGYTHTPETRVVVNCTLTDSPEDGAYAWQAVFGARGGITNQAFMFFSRQGGNDRGGYVVGTVEQWGEEGNNLPHNEPIVIDCQGNEAKVYRAADYPGGSPVITIYNSSTPTAGNCPMMIFTNNNNAGRQGSDTHYGSYSALMQLTRFQVFEGEATDPVMDLRPYVLITGDAGLKDELTGKRFHAEEGTFAVPEGVEVDPAAGIAVYPGKRVNYLKDNHEYKWDGTKWIDLGEMTVTPIETDIDYANMVDNWTAPADKYACFGIARGDNAEGTPTATYDPATKTNDFPAYMGGGMHEPIAIRIPAVAGNFYRYSFDFGSEGWDCSWNPSTTMRAGVLSNMNLSTLNNGFAESCTALGGANGVLAFYKLPTEATYNDDDEVAPTCHVSMDFEADKDEFYLLFPFGFVSDEKLFHFIIANIQVSDFKYPDLYSELNLTKPVLQVLVNEVSEFEGSTTDKLQSDLDAALQAAKDALAGTDEAAMKDAMAALNTAYNAAKQVNIAILRQTVALAETEGITENIQKAKDFFVDGTDVNVSNNLLYLIRNQRRLLHVEQYDDLFSSAANEPESMGDFYIYNVGQKRFLCGGDDWGAHAAVGYPGALITLYEAYDDEGMPTEGAFEIDTHLNNGGDNEYLNYGGYMDTAAMDDWMFVPVDGKPGVFNIVRAVENTDTSRGSLLGFRKGSYNVIDTDVMGEDDPDNQWVLVTEADREALLANATCEVPVDATWLIHSPGFNQREKADDPEYGWTIERDPTGEGPNTNIYGYNSNRGDFVFECWNGGNKNNEFAISQDITAPAEGWYIAAVQGYYRDGNTTNQIEVIENGGEKISEANLWIYEGMNSANVALRNIFDEEALNQAPGYQWDNSIGAIPNSCDQAVQFFQLGHYWNALKVHLDEGSTFTIMVDKVTETFEDWTVIDNFRLFYCGAEEPTDEQVTGVEEVINNSTRVAPAKIFNLQGMQVKNTKQNGIYIVNGKKVIVK